MRNNSESELCREPVFTENYLPASHYCDKTPEKISLKLERLIFAHGSRAFRSWSLGSVISGPVVRQNIMMGVHSGAEWLF
jgi:hypothetical protein